MRHKANAYTLRAIQRGFSLIEVLIGMVLGLVMVAASVAVFSTSRSSQATVESNSDNYANLRMTRRLLEHDTHLAGNFGRVTDTAQIFAKTGSVGALDTETGDCADGFYADVDRYIYVINGSHEPVVGCITADDHVDGSDILVLRYANPAETRPAEDSLDAQLYIYANPSGGKLFTGNNKPAPSPISGSNYSAFVQKNIYPVTTHIYYLSPWTKVAGDGVKSLKRLRLDLSNTDSPYRHELVATDVEDFQVQMGVEECNDATGGPDDACKGNINKWVDADDSDADDNKFFGDDKWSKTEAIRKIRSLAVWLRYNSQYRPRQASSKRTYEIAGQSEEIPANQRVWHSTFKIRNSNRYPSE